MKCNICGNMIDNESTVCLVCGEVSPDVKPTRKRLMRTKAIILFPILISMLSVLCMSIIADKDLGAKNEKQIQIQQAIKETGFEWYEVKDGICINKYVGEGTEVYMPEEILGQKVVSFAGNMFYGSNISSITIPETVKIIPDSAFKNCENLIKVTIVNGCIEIRENAFENCTALKTIELPESVKKIGADCFNDCSSLETVVLNEGLEELGNGAFRNCKSLCKITIPSTVSSVGEACFQDDRMLSEVNLLEGKMDATIGTFAFSSTSLKEVNVPGNYVLIDSFCFEYCRSLEKVVWQKSIQGCSEQSMGKYVFPQHGFEFHGTSTITSIKDSLNVLKSTIIYAPENSYLMQYAQENGYKYIVEGE